MRKSFILSSLLLISLFATAQNKKPNIIFMITDDQRFDGLSIVQQEQGKAARFSYLQTPNMDRIAKEGVRFRNAFVTLSLCSPSRASMLTGQYNHINGIVNNYQPFTDSVNTLPALLRTAGYKTALIGKWHMGSQKGKRPGYDYSASYIAHGKYYDCPFEVDGVSEPTKGWIDDVATDYAIDFIKKNKDHPFALTLAFKAPHGGWTPPKRYDKLYDNVKLTRPVNEKDKPAYVSFIYPEYAAADKELFDWTDLYGMKRVIPYWETVKGADDGVGRVLDLLKELKLEENTVIIFTSDNGYFHGEHALQDKRAAYEESMRVPLLIKYPARFPRGKIVDEMALNLDLPSTMLELAGVKPPERFQGKSLVSLIQGKQKDWRKSFLFQYFYESNSPTPTLLAVRTDKAKLVKYPHQDDWAELFDLEKDPYEMNNLYNKPEYSSLKEKMEKEFEKQLIETRYKDPKNAPKLPLDDNGKYIPYKGKPNQ
ncbi:DUF4976 domain-containing protein [Pedobacter frigiditerrae]|uniref:DUF4976 domain-containing protein n=1 Tax=Pedobacter frigiditerrae TaxID=2530452 RepID=A0A4R0MRE9_9SPHI|nr:sulfatase [Pedobacter frigiditerrae]TCC88614.1 DUF4976 domain-containing protein [Pedobacter frigiditerrae]